MLVGPSRGEIRLGAGGGAVSKICSVFGDDVLAGDGAIDRNRLGQRVFQNPEDRRILEKILHPLVADDREKFLARLSLIHI